MAEPTIFIAFIAGLASFLSPCILPIIPGFIAYLSGASGKKKVTRSVTFLNSLFFVLGFSIVFSLMGVLLNTVLEHVSYTVQEWLSYVGGVIIIVFGLYVLGLLELSFLRQEHRINVKKSSITYVTSFLFGAAFAVGWSPCVGAVLGSVLALALTQPGLAFWLLVAYSIGLGVPFLIAGLVSDKLLVLIRRSGTFLKYFNWVVGALLVVLGILVFTNNLNMVANWGYFLVQ